MASIDSGADDGGKKGPGVKKAKKLSTRVDMTPMVDLGFLLITFFIFTATMSSPTTLDLNVPKDVDKEEDETKIKESGALTILLGKDNHVYYYQGKLLEDGSNFKVTTYKGIRDEIIRVKKHVISEYRTDPKCEAKAASEGKPKDYCYDQDFVVVIKPNNEATYENTVTMLDEMAINVVKRYALDKIAESEELLIKMTEPTLQPTSPQAK